MGFPQQWISRIIDCISSAGFSFVVNGSLVGKVISSRGVRQSCPLSPFLFILCAEVFSSLIRGTKQDGKVLGVRCYRGSPLVSHLFFADDCVLFCKANRTCCAALKSVLSVYEKGLGQLINFQKSAFSFSPNVHSDN
ncbi:hypothetical protein ACOSQ2_007054 [Xanthoceras sorbifolium]